MAMVAVWVAAGTAASAAAQELTAPTPTDGPAAADERAVAGVSGRLAIGGGVSGDDGTGLAHGTLAIPLGEDFGARLDLGAGPMGSDLMWGGNVLLFWRDPDVGLLGGFFSNVDRDSTSARRGGVRGHVYVSRFTIRGTVGQQWGDVEEGFVGELGGRWYATDDAYGGLGGTYAAGAWLARGITEYRPEWLDLPGLSMVAGGGYGENGFLSGTLGLRYQFGDDRTLIDRDRRDIPFDSPFAATSAIQRALGRD